MGCSLSALSPSYDERAAGQERRRYRTSLQGMGPCIKAGQMPRNRSVMKCMHPGITSTWRSPIRWGQLPQLYKQTKPENLKEISIRILFRYTVYYSSKPYTIRVSALYSSAGYYSNLRILFRRRKFYNFQNFLLIWNSSEINA